MAVHRLIGFLVALIGLMLIGALTGLFYAPIPDAPQIMVAIGMPGVLLGALVAILAICIGMSFALAPRFSAGQAAKLAQS